MVTGVKNVVLAGGMRDRNHLDRLRQTGTLWRKWQ
jgi:hypothetical protein